MLPCRAASTFPTPAFKEMRHKAIDQDLSWLKPARKWEAVLEALATGSPQAKDRGAAVLTPVQTPEHVARSEKSEALREEAKVGESGSAPGQTWDKDMFEGEGWEEGVGVCLLLIILCWRIS